MTEYNNIEDFYIDEEVCVDDRIISEINTCMESYANECEKKQFETMESAKKIFLNV